jgi:hypothetical protein
MLNKVLLALLVCCGGVISAVEFSSDTNTVALYHFNEGSGTTLIDSSGNGNNGTINNCIWTTKNNENALWFNGTNSYVALGSYLKKNGVAWDANATGFSIEIIVYLDSAAPKTAIYSTYIYYQNYMNGEAALRTGNAALRTGSANGVIATVSDSAFFGSTEYDSSAGGHGGYDISSVWKSSSFPALVYMAFTWNRSMQYLYINGMKEDSASIKDSLQPGTVSSYPPSFGSFWSGDGRYFRGSILECRVSSFARPDTAFSNFWNRYSNVPAPSVPALSSPANGFVNVPINTTLAWNAVLGATSYRAQFSNTSTFSLVSDTTVFTTSRIASSLVENSLYFWRVNATNSSGSSAWSSIWSFTTLDTSLISFWAFNEGSGTLLHDSSGSNRTAHLYNGASWTTGFSGSAVLFTDSSNYIQADSTSAYSNFSSAVTFSLWFKPTVKQAFVAQGMGGSGVIMNKWTFAAEDKTIVLDTDMTIDYNIFGAMPTNVKSKSHLQINQWTNITVTYNGAAAVLYINGVLDTSMTCSGLIGNGSGNLYIGNNPSRSSEWGPSNGALGAIDKVRIYKRALSVSDVLALYNNDLSAPILSAPVLSSPANGGVNVPINTSLSWNPSVGATSYRVQLSNTTSFTLVNDTTVATTSRVVSFLSPSTTYYWHVNAIGVNDTSSWSNVYSFTTSSTAVLSSKVAALSKSISFSNAALTYDLPISSPVSITLYDIQGRIVKQLVNAMQNAGSYKINFSRARLTAGYYIVEFKAGDLVVQKKLALID